MTRLIYTASPASALTARDELAELLPDFRAQRVLVPGVVLAETGASWEEVAGILFRSPPAWTRHIQPVAQALPLQGDAGDLLLMENALPQVLLDLDSGLSFSVQARLLGEGKRWSYTRYDLNQRLAAIAASWGAALDVRSPDQVISVTCTASEAFLGLSLASQNLSAWAGGEIRFRKEPDQISRAEFKLLEALEVFGIALPESGRALDMGAAPGGWTRILASRGMMVTAVDPAELDPRVLALPGVKHLRTTVQEAVLKGRFDVILNDMRMDARDSGRLMNASAHLLKPGGVAIMTLKLPEDRQESVAEAAFRILRKRFEITAARQLFHNRSELTVALEAAL